MSPNIFYEEQIAPLVLQWKSENNVIVFTNGCFDILHRGHIDYLKKTKELGDFLIIGVNTDRSIQQIKGENRPIQDEQSRAEILAALRFVDAVVFFNDETPKNLIKVIQPHILVKGGDYKEITQIVGYDTVTALGGVVKTIPFLEGYSTTGIINKILNSYG